MKNSTYPSVPLVATIIGSKSRKAMYCLNVMSIDGTKTYKNAWIPTSFTNYDAKIFLYNNPSMNIINRRLIIGNSYEFGNDSFRLTAKGPVDYNHSPIDIDGLSAYPAPEQRIPIAWEHHSQSLVEFPLSQVTPAMQIDEYDFKNVSRIKSRLVNGKVQQYYQSLDRYIIFIPQWMMKNFERHLTFVSETKSINDKDIDTDIFPNDNNPETIVEQTKINSELSEQFNYLDRREMNFEDYQNGEQLELF